MPKIKVVTDSVAQVPPKLAEHHHIGIIPFSVTINDKSYLDGENISPTELYRRMRTEDIVPQTSHPSMGEYIQFFKKYLDKDAQAVLYLTLSGKLSGAFSTATKAALRIEKEFPGKKVAVFDTRTATIAQGFIAIRAAQAVQSGADFAHVIKTAQEEQSKVGFVAMLETLTYLARSGRVGKAPYLVGSLVQIKPVLTINNEGAVTPLVNLRGEKKCVGKLVDCMANTIGNRTPTQIAVMHADDIEKAEELSQQARERFNVEEIMFTDFTPVMGAHTGPGVLGLGYTLE